MMTSSTASSGFGQFEIDTDSTSFQPIDMGHVGTGAMDNAAYPPGQPSWQQQQQNQQLQEKNESQGWFQKWFSCCSVTSMQSYFDVDTEDVITRVIGTIRHVNSPDHFVNEILRKPGKQADLYGPVWITMSCVFLFAVTSNTSKYLHTESLKDFEYDISLLTHAFYILSFYTFAYPTILSIILKLINIPLSLIELISLYGYSLVPYIPITIICLLPSILLEWFFLLCATLLSLLFILRNIGGPLVRTSMSWSGPIMMGIMGCHAIFYFVLKWTFYRHRYHGSGDGSTNNKSDEFGIDNIDDALND